MASAPDIAVLVVFDGENPVREHGAVQQNALVGGRSVLDGIQVAVRTRGHFLKITLFQLGGSDASVCRGARYSRAVTGAVAYT